MSAQPKPAFAADYVDVKERIRLFYEKHPDGRLVTSSVHGSDEPDGTPRIWVEALAYRTPDDPLPGHGWSWMVLPGATSFTRGSEIENTETSAWGRAIGSLGIGISKSIASDDEIKGKAGEMERPAPVARMPRQRASTVPPAIPDAEVDELTPTYCMAEDQQMETGPCALRPGHDGPHKNRGGIWPQ